jgi:hypothetical protein
MMRNPGLVEVKSISQGDVNRPGAPENGSESPFAGDQTKH